MKNLVFVLAMLLGGSARAEEIKPLVDHFKHDGALANKRGPNEKLRNEDLGYLVSIEAVELISKSDSYYAYKTNLSLGGGPFPVILKRGPELDLEFDAAVQRDGELQRYNMRLAREGGGDPGSFIGKKSVRLFVIGRPAGFGKYAYGGEVSGNVYVFDIEQVCKKGFKSCRQIKEAKKSGGFFSGFFGGK